MHSTQEQLINRKYAAMQSLLPNFQAAVGDAFNLQNLANLLVQLETNSKMTPQLAEATEYANFVPVHQNFPAVIGTSHELQRKRGIGEGQAYSGTGGDIPLAEVLYDSIMLPVKAGVIGYQYSIHELATAAQTGIALESDKVAAARLGFEKHMSTVAWIGEPATGLKGLINQTGVDTVTATTAWDTATPEAILEDINNIIADALDTSQFDGAIRPNTILLPTSLMRVLTSRFVFDTRDTTIFDYIGKNNMLALEGNSPAIRATKRLETAGVGGSRRIVVYCRDPSCIEMRIPQDLTFLAPQTKDLDIFTPGHYLYQGVWLKRVDSLRYLDIPQA